MKKYQIFISSTYKDLKEERQAVLESVLEMRHIPAGMEYFVAANEEQFQHIKKILDETDYYIIIVGNRYGSIADDGLSYTEKEFDYAVSLGIPIIACVHSDPDSLPVNKSEKDTDTKEKLEKFRQKVMHNRMVSCFDWTNPDSLARKTATALKNVMEDNPRKGWVRAESSDNSELLAQIDNLKKENEELSAKNEELTAENGGLAAKLEAFKNAVNEEKIIEKFNWQEKIIIQAYRMEVLSDNNKTLVEAVLSWKQCFSVIGRVLCKQTDYTSVRYAFSRKLFSYQTPPLIVTVSNFQRIMTEFARLHLVFFEDGNVESNIFLTQQGQNFLTSTAPVGDDVPGNDVLEITRQKV